MLHPEALEDAMPSFANLSEAFWSAFHESALILPFEENAALLQVSS